VPILDVRITHALPWAGQPQAVCRVSIFQRNGQTVVVLTEPWDNQGVSVTNAVEYIAGAVTDLSLLWEKHPDEVTWIEHYPRRGEGIRIEETWDLVEFDWEFDEGWHASNPRWHPMNKADVTRILIAHSVIS
jgi:outer membrane biogenesis lipoprotein LolB